LDGTILDTRPVYAQASKDLNPNLPVSECLEHGLKIGREIENNGGKSIVSLTDSDLNKWLKAWYANQKELSKLFDDFIPLIRFLKAHGVNLAINTNRPHLEEQVRYQLNEYGINQYFEIVMTQKISGRAKPDPKGLHLICNELNNSTSETIFIGDSIVDIEAGNRAKIPVIAVTTGVFPKEQLENYNPRNICESLTEILEILKEEL
jgi:HAD superfamily hydrolase (TIGR01549 family)